MLSPDVNCERVKVMSVEKPVLSGAKMDSTWWNPKAWQGVVNGPPWVMPEDMVVLKVRDVEQRWKRVIEWSYPVTSIDLSKYECLFNLISKGMPRGGHIRL
jgi:hypothetical protein